jgi:glycosyltransferase involved in cell wall biosynthesis
MPSNIGTLKSFMRAFHLSRSDIFVNSSIDTLFDASLASGGRVKAGHNVITTGFVTPGTDLFLGVLDRIASRSTIGRIMATTYYQKRIYLRLGIPERDISVIPSCADSRSIGLYGTDDSPSGEHTENPTIMYAGRFVPDKGIRELFSAYEQLVQSVPVQLKIIGDGPMRTWVYQKKDEIEQKSENARVLVSAGWESREKVLREMSRADVVVLPSYHEMCPVSLLEAMCLKRAIVCTRVGGPAEMITNEVDGILVSPFQVKELKEAIYRLIADETLRRRLGLNAYRTFMQTYDVSIVAPKFRTFLESD